MVRLARRFALMPFFGVFGVAWKISCCSNGQNVAHIQKCNLDLIPVKLQGNLIALEIVMGKALVMHGL